MTSADLYLLCFLVGLALSVLSVLMGDFHIHLPHVHGFHMPVINFGTITAFLAWFGGVGYLLTRHSSLLVVPIVILSTVAGLVGATLVFLFVAKVLMKHDRDMDPADYERVGVIGRVVSSIREGGTGEIVFSLQGTRHTCGARDDQGRAIAKGVEVAITRYEKGIAYVCPWEEMSNTTGDDLQEQAKQ